MNIYIADPGTAHASLHLQFDFTPLEAMAEVELVSLVQRLDEGNSWLDTWSSLTLTLPIVRNGLTPLDSKLDNKWFITGLKRFLPKPGVEGLGSLRLDFDAAAGKRPRTPPSAKAVAAWWVEAKAQLLVYLAFVADAEGARRKKQLDEKVESAVTGLAKLVLSKLRDDAKVAIDYRQKQAALDAEVAAKLIELRTDLKPEAIGLDALESRLKCDYELEVDNLEELRDRIMLLIAGSLQPAAGLTFKLQPEPEFNLHE